MMHRYPQPRQLHDFRAFLRWIQRRLIRCSHSQHMEEVLSAGQRGGSGRSVMTRPALPPTGVLPATGSSEINQLTEGIVSANVGPESDAGNLNLISPGTAAEPPVFRADPEDGAQPPTEDRLPPAEEALPVQDVNDLPGGDRVSPPPDGAFVAEPAAQELNDLVTLSPAAPDNRDEGNADPVGNARGAQALELEEPAEAPCAEAAGDEAATLVPAVDEPQSAILLVDLGYAEEPQVTELETSPLPASATSTEEEAEDSRPSDEGDEQILRPSAQPQPAFPTESTVTVAEAAQAGSREPATDSSASEGASRRRRTAQRKNRPTPIRRTAFDRAAPKLTARFVLPDSYLRWNRVLLEYCLLEQPDRPGPAYLSITPRVLSAALEAEEGVLLSPEDATAEFIAAVSLAYRTQILNEPEKLWALAAVSNDGVPTSVGLLGLSVLAAYEMRSDEEAGPNAYYLRLATLLGCDLVAGLPRGFEPEDFGHLWDFLSHWLEERIGRCLALPGPEAGFRRFVAYPLRHVPLRKVDIDKLPEFFDSAGLEPGSKVDPALLGKEFQRWAGGRGILSQAGEAAMADDRRPAVDAQLSIELEAWDGSWTDRFGSRIAAVHVLLDFVRRRPELYFLPRRPTTFPGSFDDGSHLFESGEQGWYDQVEILPEDGPTLQNGFRWTCRNAQGAFSLHRPPSTAIALCPTAEFTGYLSQQGLPLGAKSSVLCTVAIKEAAEEFLSEVAGVHCRPLELPGLPRGWCLFSGIVPRRTLPTPLGLDALAIESDATVILRGGLRLGRRASWMAGAPPTILITGPEEVAASLDGEPIEVTNGALALSSPLRPGPHVVEVGGARRRFEIVEPEGRWEACAPLLPQETNAVRLSVALPPGAWAVVGASPGDVVHAGPSERGSLLTVPFAPVWAISVGQGPGAAVLSLVGEPPPPQSRILKRARPSASASAWVSAIYEAQIRRPRFGSLNGVPGDAALLAAWRSYVHVARQLKRRWRRLR